MAAFSSFSTPSFLLFCFYSCFCFYFCPCFSSCSFFFPYCCLCCFYLHRVSSELGPADQTNLTPDPRHCIRCCPGKLASVALAVWSRFSSIYRVLMDVGVVQRLSDNIDDRVNSLHKHQKGGVKTTIHATDRVSRPWIDL